MLNFLFLWQDPKFQQVHLTDFVYIKQVLFTFSKTHVYAKLKALQTQLVLAKPTHFRHHFVALVAQVHVQLLHC